MIVLSLQLSEHCTLNLACLDTVLHRNVIANWVCTFKETGSTLKPRGLGRPKTVKNTWEFEENKRSCCAVVYAFCPEAFNCIGHCWPHIKEDFASRLILLPLQDYDCPRVESTRLWKSHELLTRNIEPDPCEVNIFQ